MVIVAVEVLQRPLPWNTGFSTESDWKGVLERNSVSFNRLKSAYLNRNSTFDSFRFPTLFREALIKANLDWFGLISSGSKFLFYATLHRSQYRNCCSDTRNKHFFSCNLPFFFHCLIPPLRYDMLERCFTAQWLTNTSQLRERRCWKWNLSFLAAIVPSTFVETFLFVTICVTVGDFRATYHVISSMKKYVM